MGVIEVGEALTVKDISKILGVCERTGYRIVHQALQRNDMFKVLKIGSEYRIPRNQFLNWMDYGCEGFYL